jgi:dolichol-phosphate mannosyltransferase
MPNKDSVTVLLPAKNEASGIGKLVRDIRDNGYANIIVIDNSSTDGTYQIALQNGARAIDEPAKGKAIAIKRGIKEIGTPYVVMMDADNTYPAKYITDVLELLQGYEIVMAERHVRAPDSMTPTNLIGNKILSLLASVLYGQWTSDVCTGMWGFRTGILKQFDIKSRHFTLEAELFVNAVKAKRRIVRIPIVYRSRMNGSRSHLQMGHGLEIGWFLIKRRFG